MFLVLILFLFLLLQVERVHGSGAVVNDWSREWSCFLSCSCQESGAISCLVVVTAVVMFHVMLWSCCFVVVTRVVMFHVKLWSCCFVMVTRVKAFVVVTRVKGFVFLHHGHVIILLSIIYCQE